MDICPTCKRRIPASKLAGSKEYVQDMQRAKDAILCLERVIRDPDSVRLQWEPEPPLVPEFIPACEDEVERLNRALGDPALLWNIYRKGAKGKVPFAYGQAVLPKAA